MRALRKSVSIGLSIALLVLVLVITLPQRASADSTNWTSDTDWLSGTLDSNVVLKGSGPGAWLELRRADFPDWMRMAPTNVPPARDGACLVWIPEDNSFVMFGGYGTSAYLGDTWKFNWTNDQW